MAALEVVAQVVLLGAGATAVMDMWMLLMKALGVPTLNFAFVGRWVGHACQGRFVHASIRQASSVRGEVALGWVAVFYIKPLLTHGGWTILAFVIAGGALYTAGAVVYGLKRPNPSPRWFGFHEIFHALTILAFISHFVAATLALFGPIAQTG